MTTRFTIVPRAALLALCSSALCVAPVLATPGSGFAPSPIINGHFGTLNENTESNKTGKWGFLLRTKDDTDVGSDRLTVQPGGYSGWHVHPSSVFVTVTQGSIIWYDGSDPLCTPHTYHVGDSFIEHPYRVHNAKNASNSAVAEFVAIRINPTGVGFRINADKPTNC